MSLILPVLMPSWRFFKTIEPSPRVQWRFLTDKNATTGDWQDFRPRPQAVTAVQMIGRLFWNPVWNDNLFVVSCAERIEQQRTDRSITEITQRILADSDATQMNPQVRLVQFRLLFVHRDGADLVEDIVFVSDPVAQPRGPSC
ncbi:hypothetical protein [Roseobacter sp. GAI101]|uniref:hypothetical protein n=1 Tax=Roseobacter sp. (strain GAI101) TaxID=391589 RepID=UPI0012ED6443|nr:hypothetical protein [Roseobacter sp. GAI101]